VLNNYRGILAEQAKNYVTQRKMCKQKEKFESGKKAELAKTSLTLRPLQQQQTTLTKLIFYFKTRWLMISQI
jgi:hypothetical protein